MSERNEEKIMEKIAIQELHELEDHDDVCFCIDCGTCTMCIGEYYMVHDEIWRTAGMPAPTEEQFFDAVHRYEAGQISEEEQDRLIDSGGMLCVGCIEIRIGRELHPRDFTDAPLNETMDFYKSDRLKARLRG